MNVSDQNAITYDEKQTMGAISFEEYEMVDLVQYQREIFYTELMTEPRMMSYLLRHIGNVTLIGLKSNDVEIRATRLYLTAMEQELGQNESWEFTSSFETDGGARFFSCLDDQMEMKEVLMPDVALGPINWALLWVFFCVFSLVEAFLFKRGVRDRIAAISDSVFYLLSHLLLSCPREWNSRSVSWRLFVSAWLLGIGSVWHKCYLCNMKGELATRKILHLDTAEDVLRTTDGRLYLSSFQVSFEHLNTLSKRYSAFEEFYEKADRLYMNFSVTNKDVVFDKTEFFASFRKKWKLCTFVYQGDKEYMTESNYVMFSRNLSLTVKERIKYRVERFVETKQSRPSYIWREQIYDRVAPGPTLIPLKATSITFLAPVIRNWSYGILLSILAIISEFALHHGWCESF